MPDVSLLNFRKPYVLTDAAERNRESALNLIYQLLQLTGLTDSHLKDQLSIGLWKWTESAGVAPHPKFNLPYVSEGVWNPSHPVKVNHEHVWTRRSLIKRLRSQSWTKDELATFLHRCGVACIVTVEEHAGLSGSHAEGWQRYLDTGIKVWDRRTGKEANISHMLGDAPDAPSPLTTDETSPFADSDADREKHPVTMDPSSLLDSHAKPSVAILLRRLMRMARFASAVSVASVQRNGQPSAYFRIHDTLLEEPSAAVAYPHWSGRIDFRLSESDLPRVLSNDPRIKYLKKLPYSVQVTVTDSDTAGLAEELLLAALELLRSQY